MNNLINKIQPTGIFTNYVFKAIPLAFDESMSYYETLCGLLSYLKDTVIPTVNNNADAVIEVQAQIDYLQEFVNNYFENLDVQEEINNKLDEMAEDGTLAQIINVEMIGSLSNLNTTDKSNVVSAINEVNGNVTNTDDKIGTLTNLNTTDKSNVVSAINEVNGNVTNTDDKIGTLANLNTTNKSNVVSAINEVNNNLLKANTYTTSEELIGTWKGIPLYRKIIEGTSVAGYNQVLLTDIVDLGEIIFMYGTVHQDNSGNILPAIYYHSSTDFARVYYDENLNSLEIECGSDYGFGNFRIVLEYLKDTNE